MVHPIERIHRIGVDAVTGKRYSVPIDGKYLVITANPAKHPMHANFPVPRHFLKLCSEPSPPIMSVRKDLTGGHFSA
jgi:hypothetical protein